MADQIPTPAPEAPKKEKTIEVELLADVWIETGKDEKGEPIIERVTTNTPVLDENGLPKIDPKTKAPIVIIEKRTLPMSVAKILFAQEKARRADPLPE